MKFVLVKSGWLTQKWHFRIVADNGEILASSEKYNNRIDCYAAIRRIKNDAGLADVFDEDGERAFS
jgi:uncharacterized protein YegP (UPF0339 family)